MTNWKALPDEGLLKEVGEGRGGAMEVNPVEGELCWSAELRLDQRKRAGWERVPETPGEVRGERREP